MLIAAWVFLVACGASGQQWTGDVRQVDAVIVDNTRKVWVDGGNVVTSPYRRLIVVDGDRLSSRKLATEPLVLKSDGQTIIIFSYWDEAQAVKTRRFREIETSDQAWLQTWRWHDGIAAPSPSWSSN